MEGPGKKKDPNTPPKTSARNAPIVKMGQTEGSKYGQSGHTKRGK
jgi:hypothetical protein